jgi:phenylacetic acid degradation operon negative regulatory protein
VISGKPAAAVHALVDRFHERKPVRAWSLIVTLYGDAVVPRGGSLWLGSLTELMALFRIDAGHVRTAMSRLTADGWLVRERIGRNSYYRLSARSQTDFLAAAQRIYVGHERRFDGRLRLALLGSAVDGRAALRPALEQAGFAALSPTAFVAVADPPADFRERDGLFLLTAEAGDAAALAAAAFRLAPIAAAYRAFITLVTPLAEALEGAAEARVLSTGDAPALGTSDAPALGTSDALIARILLIHEFRRIVLRDPGLPSALLPPDWPGGIARALTARIYRAVAGAAERHLDASAHNEHGPLRPAGADFASRFGPPLSE